MRIKLAPGLFPAVLLFVAALPAFAQTGPAANKGGVPIVIGAGMSYFSPDWGPGRRLVGVSAWVDLFPRGLPRRLDGLGIEAAGHALDFAVTSDTPPKLRQDTGEAGVIYAWNRYRNFRPYAKFLAGVGSIDFLPYGTYSHDTFLVTDPAGGAEYRIWQHVWIRGDYEYQYWHHTFGPHDLNPNGITIGASYDFRPIRNE